MLRGGLVTRVVWLSLKFIKQPKDLLETALRVSTSSIIPTSEIGVGQYHAFVDVITTCWTLPSPRTLTEVPAVLVDARTTVTTRVAQTFVSGQQLKKIRQKKSNDCIQNRKKHTGEQTAVSDRDAKVLAVTLVASRNTLVVASSIPTSRWAGAISPQSVRRLSVVCHPPHMPSCLFPSLFCQNVEQLDNAYAPRELSTMSRCWFLHKWEQLRLIVCDLTTVAAMSNR